MPNGPRLGTTTPGDPFRPSPAGGDFSTQGIIQRMLAGLRPPIQQGTQAVRRAIEQAGRRRGQFGAFDIASQATEPFAQALGQAASRAGVAGEQLGAQMEQQLRALTQAREQAEQARQIEEARLAEVTAGRQQAGQFQLFPFTGFTPELLQNLGFPGTAREPFGPRREFQQLQRSLMQLGLPGLPFGGGGGPNPFLTAAQRTRLQQLAPGASQQARIQQAMNLGLIPGPIQPGQFRT